MKKQTNWTSQKIKTVYESIALLHINRVKR